MINDDQAEKVKAYLRSFELLSKDEIDEFTSLTKTKTLKKGEHFIKTGKVCKEVAFITSGLFRSYYYSSEQEETTYCFTFSNTFLTAYSSFISGQPTTENIEALSPVELVSISKKQLAALEEKSVNWLRFAKLMAEREYIAMEKRIYLLQSENAETKYNYLLKNHAAYLQLIPLKYLASYLGITQRHLSRIRSAIGAPTSNIVL